MDDFDNYRPHLSKQWCPMVTIIGSVASCIDNALEAAERCYFTFESSVYETLKTVLA